MTIAVKQKNIPASPVGKPKLRFSDFFGEWEEKRLGEVGDILNGLTYTPKDTRKEGLLVLRSSNIQNDKLAYEDCVYVESDNKSANISKVGDIIICVRNGSERLIGKNAIIKSEVPRSTHGAFMASFRAKVPNFLIQLFKTSAYKKQVYIDLGARINSINSSQLKKNKFFFPPLPEQQKIAEFLTSLDNLIESKQQQIAQAET